MSKVNIIAGNRYNKLTALYENGKNKRGNILWRCVCDCGNECDVASSHLINGHKKSCGCLGHRDVYKFHGHYGERLYAIWSSLKGRCYNVNNTKYKNYGKRGITVCDEWNNDYDAFRTWAYQNGYNEKSKYGECTLDRIDVDGNYEPSNCRFVSIAEQMLNTTRNKDFICVETGVVWNNMHECARGMNLDHRHIWDVLRGDRKTHGGYHFHYI